MRSPVDYKRSWPEGYRAMSALNQAVQSSGLEHPLLELVKIRASQLNGCAYCLDMHTLVGMLDRLGAQDGPVPLFDRHSASWGSTGSWLRRALISSSSASFVSWAGCSS